VEMLGLTSLAGAYQGRRVLLTGHTGFKGSWLALWLTAMGARVTGIALAPPTQPNHWDLLGLAVAEHRIDIRDAAAIRRIVANENPEVVFHLAAQPLVLRSYEDPVETWSTNVMGTANLLEACRDAPDLRAIVIVTSDKCYENRGKPQGYREGDRLGGYDPYSASKAATELVADSYRKAFFHAPGTPLLATARAGNVIGGGDWAADRLIPDLVRAQAMQASLGIRSPNATRPWQHVLESLSGYLQLGAKLAAGDRSFAEAWNFGPPAADARSVSAVLSQMQTQWPGLRWHVDAADAPHEADVLALDSTKARTRLGWRPVWSLEQAIEATAGWYRNFLATGRATSRDQLANYIAVQADVVPVSA
jgi:CDP-glucose 4,6-dehydratase